METDIQSSVLPTNLPPALANKLNQLSPGTFCVHKSWGFGQIKEWNSAGQMIIDFQHKKGHLMQFQYAAETLSPLPGDHILVQKAQQPDELRKKAKENHVELMTQLIGSLGANATADTIQSILSPEIIAEAEWKKWWEACKRALKKDGHFFIPTKKSEPFRSFEQPNALGGQALDQFRAAIGPKALLNALVTVDKHWTEIHKPEVAEEIRALINQTLSKMPKTQLSMALELALSRDEFLLKAGLPSEAGALAVVGLSPSTPNALTGALEGLPGLKQTKLLASLRAGMKEEWAALFIGLLPRANGRVAEGVMQAFIADNRAPEFVAAVNRLLRERSVTCDFLYWFCKNRDEIFSSLIEPQLMMAILSVLEQDQLSEIKKGTKLYELVLSDKELVSLILKNAPYEDVRDITRAILLSPVFEELDKRSLLATIIKLYPDVQSMIVGGEKSSEEAALIVSWESLTRRKAELEEITLKKIPENSREIGIARSYGDLRENHEFKAAKEMQTVLMRRKAELESMLSRAQGTDFAATDLSTVNIGTTVFLKENGSGETLSYTILGAWDSDPVQGVISYLTPVAKALFSHKVGDSIKLPADGSQEKTVTIEKIEAYKK